MFRPYHYPQIDSTNLEARRLIEAGTIGEKSVIYADVQTKGQGSRGRNWDSASGQNLLSTYIIPLDADIQHPHLAVYVISLAVLNFTRHLLPPSCDIKIKWPNDLLINEHKTAGMLHEIAAYRGKFYFIAGIGMNVAWHPELENTFFPATCLSEHTSTPLEIDKLVPLLGTEITSALHLWRKHGFSVLMQEIMPHFYKYQKNITVYPAADRSISYNGTFEHIDEQGALVLQTENGQKRIMTGDIFPGLKNLE